MQTNATIEHVDVTRNRKGTEGHTQPWVLGIGLMTMALGVGAIVLPFIATFAIELLIGVALVFVGGMQIAHAISGQLSKEATFRLLAGAAYGAVGLFLVLFPRQGAVALTLLLAMLFILLGTAKIALAFHMRPSGAWGWFMLNGIVATALGVLIWAGLPSTAAWAIGLLVGIDLLLSGWIIVMSAKTISEDGSTAPLENGSSR